MFKSTEIKYFFFFIFLYLLFRYLSPFGYEPDFWIRAPEYVQLEGAQRVNNLFVFNHNIPIISPLIRNLDINSFCNIEDVRINFKDHLISGGNENTVLSLFQTIDHHSCTQSLKQILLRTLLLVVLVFPFWLIFFMKKTFFKFFSLFIKKIDFQNYSKNIDSIILSLFFSGMMYYLGVIAYEQLALLISLSLLLFYRNIFILIPLTLVLFIDFGNSFILVSIFFISYVFTLIFYKLKYVFYVIAIILSILISYYFSYNLLNVFKLEYLSEFVPSFFSIYIESIHNHHYVESLKQTYPLFVRPIIFFMTFIYWTPGNIKIILSYLFIGILFFHFFIKYNFNLAIYKKFNKTNLNKDDLFHTVFTNNLIFSVIIFVFILPMYCNAKYYIFILPFIIRVLLNYFKKEHVLLIFIILSLINFTHLILYRFL